MNGKHIHLKWSLTRDWWNATGLDLFKRQLALIVRDSVDMGLSDVWIHNWKM